MLDFSKRPKRYWDLVLHDGTKLQIPPPTMGIYGEMMAVSGKGTVDEEELCRIVATVLRANKQGVEVTQEQIDAFDIDDMFSLFTEYAGFTQEVLSDPNYKSLIVP